MRIDLASATAVLERTPRTLRTLLTNLPEPLERGNEGGESWSPYDILGHLIHGERTDWIPRMRIILEHGESQTFEPFDRFAQFEESRGKGLDDLLAEFEAQRTRSLTALGAFDLQPADFEKTGRHPELGAVTLGELLATWAVHDLSHISQTARVMARQLDTEVGPWRAYLPILAGRPTD